MPPTSKKEIKKILRNNKVYPLKQLGQNFLIDKNILLKIINASFIKSKDVVLEIGPGLGILTQELAKKAKRVVAIEKDKRIINLLKERLSRFNNVKLINKDARYYNPKIANYKVVANLPFGVAIPIIRKFLENKNQPKKMVLMVQKEVAQRICAQPPEMSLLAVSVQFYAKTKIVSFVSKKCFWPQPKVDAGIIEIIPKKPSGFLRVKKKDFKQFKKLFFKIVKAGFSQPRKQLVNNLSKVLKLDKEKTMTWLLKNKINPKTRAENLKIKDWISLTKTFKVYFCE